MSTAHIPLSAIQFDSATQIRAVIDNEVVQEYADAMKAGERFPAIDVFADEGKEGVEKYWLADGWHRAMAHGRINDVTVPVVIHQGGKEEAIKFALSANAKHGLKRNTADKIKAVAVAFERFAGMSDRAIADLCAVSPTFVGKHRPQLSTVDSCHRKGLDGKTRNLPVSKPAELAPAVEVVTADTPLTPLQAYGLREMERQLGADITSPEKTDEQLKAEALAFVAANPEEQAKLEEVRREGEALAATAAVEVRAPILRPSGAVGGGGFDSARWKLRAREVLIAWMAEVPVKHRQAAAEYLRNQVSEIEGAEG